MKSPKRGEVWLIDLRSSRESSGGRFSTVWSNSPKTRRFSTNGGGRRTRGFKCSTRWRRKRPQAKPADVWLVDWGFAAKTRRLFQTPAPNDRAD